MKTELKQSFFKVFTGTLLWLSFILTTYFKKGETVSINFLWNVIAVSLISAFLFGVLYSALWNHFTLKPIFNILIGSFANTVGGFLALWLLVRPVFYMVLPWVGGVTALSLVLHWVAFYFYAKYDNRRKAIELNQILS